MATPLSEIYDYFLSKVSDYHYLELNEKGLLEQHLNSMLRSALVKFTNCSKDLTINKVENSMLSVLDDFELEIITSLMSIRYVSNKVLDVKNMEQIMTDSDFSIYSQANHLSQMIALRKDLQLEVSHLMNEYSFKDGLDDIE